MKRILLMLLFILVCVRTSHSQSGWVRQDLSPNEILSSVFFVNESTGFIGSCGISSNIYKTTNAGLNWFTTIGNLSSDLWCVYFLNSNTGFAAYRNEILKTTNSGESWNSVYVDSRILFSIVFTSLDTGYACGKWTTMLKTTNGGNNWFTLTISGGMYQELSFIDNSTGFTVSEYDYVTKTTDGGANWIRKNVGYNSRLYSVMFLNTNTGFCGGYNGYNTSVFKTTDGGESWLQKLSGPQGRIYQISFVNIQTGYTVGTAIFKSTNAGETWQIQQNMRYNELYSVYFINQLTGYACGVDTNQIGMLYKTTTGGEPIGIQPISTEMPDQFILFQNYPNPFNPNTKIKFSLPPSKGARGMITKISIYNILGKEVEVLLNKALNPGTYEVDWDASYYPSGVYFYRLITDKYIATNKMILLK